MSNDDFYQSDAWRSLTKKVYKRYGRQCQATGLKEKDGITLSIDHIKPRARYPKLALSMSNLQVLELGLNKTKGLREWDFRPRRWRLYYKFKKLILCLLLVASIVLLFQGELLTEIQAGQSSDQENSLNPIDEAARYLERSRLDFCLSDFVLSYAEPPIWLSQLCEMPSQDQSAPDSLEQTQQRVYGQAFPNTEKTLVL